ncbi:MAG: hypothetical protein DRR08_04720 [Candidatus Parabeggiatoa sp. nov. 2]|nr:MAG: hypothetical protein B6247_12540 [Beggiatoa sp. 4572_84]RKZ62966.1 MAG: hypothetical protein DRR08_04720 [Gammaproteobacteria bacterium]
MLYSVTEQIELYIGKKSFRSFRWDYEIRSSLDSLYVGQEEAQLCLGFVFRSFRWDYEFVLRLIHHKWARKRLNYV